MNPDPWTNEDDGANDTPENGASQATAATETTAAPEVKAPNVFADPAIPTLVLPKPEIQATASAPEKKTESEEKTDTAEFPNDYGKCLKIAAEMSGAARLGDKPTPAQTAAHRKYLRLQKHIHAIQQGTPVIHVDTGTPAAFVGINHAGLSETKLRYLARSNRDVKKLLEQRDALQKENAQIKSANEELVNKINQLQERLQK